MRCQSFNAPATLGIWATSGPVQAVYQMQVSIGAQSSTDSTIKQLSPPECAANLGFVLVRGRQKVSD